MKIALLAINAAVKGSHANWPHYGLTLLATRLSLSGHMVRVFDQSFLGLADDVFVSLIKKYSPDTVGISLYTTHVTRSLAILKKINSQGSLQKTIAGGPHASLYSDALKETGLFDVIVTGEADDVIDDVISMPTGNCTVVTGGAVRPELIMAADYSLAEGHSQMEFMPIQLSRGCPFNCSFCEVKNIASRKIRYRDIDICLGEIFTAVSQLKNVHTLRIVDDCPTLDHSRFKNFLRKYIKSQIPWRISIDNMRADTIDDELLKLLKKCHIPHVCIAAESGNPEVFKLVDKGESLEDIRKAANIIRTNKISLQMCFVIGLPGSSFSAEMDSLKLARELKPDIIYWNMFLPHRGTRAREWFVEHGSIYEEYDRFSVPAYDLSFTPPAVETKNFSSHDRIRAYLKCVFETVSFVFTPKAMLRAVRLTLEYSLYTSFIKMIFRIPSKFVIYIRILIRQKMYKSRLLK